MKTIFLTFLSRRFDSLLSLLFSSLSSSPLAHHDLLGDRVVGNKTCEDVTIVKRQIMHEEKSFLHLRGERERERG